MPRKRTNTVDPKAKEILSNLFLDGNTIVDEIKAENEIIKLIQEYKDTKNMVNMNVTLQVKDTSVIEWKSKEHFTKVFNDEIKYIKQIYGLSKGERNLLNSLPPFLLWESNLLVNDETKDVINQGQLADLLEIDRTTIYRNMKGLIEKKIVVEYSDKNSKYYLINPNVMYSGRKINKGLIQLFKYIGYVDRVEWENNKKS
jgi:hypothetical protein